MSSRDMTEHYIDLWIVVPKFLLRTWMLLWKQGFISPTGIFRSLCQSRFFQSIRIRLEIPWKVLKAIHLMSNWRKDTFGSTLVILVKMTK